MIGKAVDAKTRAFLEPRRKSSEGSRNILDQDLDDSFGAYFENI